jgi:hypothetical protein
LILGRIEMKDFVKQMNRYYGLRYDSDLSKEEIEKIEEDGIESIFSFVLSLDKKFFMESDGIHYGDDIDLLKISYIKSEFNNLIKDKFSLIEISRDPFVVKDYFLSLLLCNEIISSTKIFFRFNEKEIMIHINIDSTHIERINFGSILYYEYFSNKYKNICYISENYFETIYNEAKDLNYKIQTERSSLFKETLPEMLYLLGYQNTYLNCNWYIYELFQYVIQENKIIFEIVYDDSYPKYQRLLFQKDLENKIKKCLSSSSSSDRYILIPLRIIKKEWKDESHKNMLLVDRARKLVERYEPHGTSTARRDKDLNFELVSFFLRYGLEYRFDLCSVSGIQGFENQLPEPITGKCVSLSYGYLDHRLENISKQSSPVVQSSKKRKYPPEIAPIAYYNQVSEKGITHWIDIEDLNKKIFSEFQSYLDKINKYFGSSLYFLGNTLSFKNVHCKK